MGSALIISFKRLGFLLACALTIGNSTFATAIGQPKNEPKEIWIGDVLSDEDRITYRGYVLQRKNRTVVDPEIALKPIDVSYAVLHRNRQRPMKFDANVYFGLGNDTRFGLISILGNQAKQAIISQDVYRGGNQGISTLSRRPRIIFDGRIWSVGREGDDMNIADLDGDGVYEISVPTCIFYGFHNLSPAATPLSTIIFKYSKRARRYLPANPRFAGQLLADIEEREQQVRPPTDTVEEMNHLGDVMAVLLDYIFAGRRREGWIFYDRVYKLPDKRKVKREILAELRDSPAYRFIYRRRNRRAGR